MNSDPFINAIRIINHRRPMEQEPETWPAVPPGELEDYVDVSIPKEGLSSTEVMDHLESLLQHAPVTTGPTFFNQLYGGRIDAATAADMLASFLNESMYTYKVAGIQALIEREVIGKMLSFVGFEDGEGTLAPGGSISNLVATIVARNEAAPEVRNTGMDGRRYTMYTSDQSHYSIPKNAGIVGIGRENVRVIPTDETGHMRVDALEEALAADRDAGCVPTMINATAGTTVLGVFDPLEAIADVAQKHNVWLHVDAAWGGTLLLHKKLRTLLAGCERADSFTWDAHKMMGVPLVASAILMKRPGLLEKHFSEQAGYLFQSDEEEDEYDLGRASIQCGRRNDALKIWVAWQVMGDKGYFKRISKQRRLADYAARRIAADDRFELLMKPESLNVCFRLKGADSRAICKRLDETGQAKIGYGAFRGEDWLRLVTVNPDLKQDDIDRLLEAVAERDETAIR